MPNRVLAASGTQHFDRADHRAPTRTSISPPPIAFPPRSKRRRIARGEKPVGWKIGFTNSAIWAEQGLNAPIWGPMYDTTVSAAAASGYALRRAVCWSRASSRRSGSASRAFRNPAWTRQNCIDCVDAVTHGFEIVQSVYPGWRLKPPDAVAAFGMHGGYATDRWSPIAAAERERWLEMLVDFTVVLFRDGVEMDRGVGRNVLGGPLSALRHFVAARPNIRDYALKPGDLITTGTLTRASHCAGRDVEHRARRRPACADEDDLHLTRRRPLGSRPASRPRLVVGEPGC